MRLFKENRLEERTKDDVTSYVVSEKAAHNSSDGRVQTTLKRQKTLSDKPVPNINENIVGVGFEPVRAEEYHRDAKKPIAHHLAPGQISQASKRLHF